MRPGTAIGYVGVARPRVQVVSLAGARLRSSLRGCPRLAAAGAWGGCACGQRDQSDQAAARQWRGPVNQRSRAARVRAFSTALIEPGRPWQNGVTESFNGKFRDECLSLEWFRSRVEAKVIIEAWRHHYNEVRLDSSFGHLTPNEFVARGARPAPHRQRAGTLRYMGPPRPGPLLNPPFGDKCSE